jgi:segregation and condensation protein A
MPYQVHLTVFDGPLDLLLQLIESRALDISQVSLALVTDQYLQYIQNLEVIRAEELTDFLVVAAQLLVIKSRLLLPSPTTSPSDEETEDVGQSLAQQLEAYGLCRAAAQQLRTREETGQRAFVRAVPPSLAPPALPQGAASPAQLLDALQRVMTLEPPAPPVSDVVSPIAISIADQMSLIRERMRKPQPCPFPSLFSPSSSRVEMIVTFLALLELLRLKEVIAWQEGVFSVIMISTHPSPGEACQEGASAWPGDSGIQ